MINRVVVAGRILAGPTIHESGNKAFMTLEVMHPKWEGGVERSRVEVLVPGRRRAEIVEEYLGVGRPVLVQGHLEQDGQQARVVLERFEFMMDDITTRYFEQETPQPKARAAA